MYRLYYCYKCDDFFLNYGDNPVICGYCEGMMSAHNSFLVKYIDDKRGGEFAKETLAFVKEHRKIFKDMAEEFLSLKPDIRKAVASRYEDVVSGVSK